MNKDNTHNQNTDILIIFNSADFCIFMNSLTISKSSSKLILPNGRRINLIIRHSRKARHILIRIDDRTGHVLLVLPMQAELPTGLAFVKSKTRWIQNQLEKIPSIIPFNPGVTLPIYGRDITFNRLVDPTQKLSNTENSVYLQSTNQSFTDDVSSWLKLKARHIITSHAEILAQEIEKPFTKLRISDPVSRWGSCSASGRLSFSWRLILSPPEVLHYVVAHEICHLKEMNHGPKFWVLVASLCKDHKVYRNWLKKNGSVLRRYG